MIPQTEFIKNLLVPSNNYGQAKNFVNYIEDMSLYWEEKIRKSIKETLEEMDLKFRNSPNRTSRYYVAYTGPRTFVCMYGEVTFTRTLYKDRSNNSYYCYVDEKLGIDKYIRYTNDVACYVTEAYADENSMIKIGVEVGNLIYAKFSLKDNRDYALPRQTIFNLMKRSKEIRIEPLIEKKVIDNIYILTDEKYLPGHKKEDGSPSSKMLKAALIVEGLDKSNKRHKYINPQYLSLYKSENFANDILEYLNDRYDLEKLKHIHVLGDGASWIKATANELKCPNVELTQYLCKFHFSQGLWRIFKDKSLYSKAIDYLYHNDKKDLYELFKAVGGENETIKKYVEYIKNNYDLIQNTIHLKDMNCAMEQCISHHIHSEFDNVPKVYGSNNLNRYCSYRDNYRNKENMKKLFIEALEDKDDETDVTIINKTHLNLEHFDNQSILPYYSLKLVSGKTPVSFKCPSALSLI